jgi:hypothetical protein
MTKLRFYNYLPLVILLSIFSQQVSAKEYTQTEWLSLMPADDLDALMNPPSYLNDIEDGSLEDQLSSQLTQALESAGDSRYQQALVSTDVVEAMNNQDIRIAAYIVPLELNKQQLVTSFFLVPYFGACIHVPPPPPNQIIYVDYPQGFKQENLYDAYWIDGTLVTSITENDVALSAYKMTADHIELYSE